MHDSDDDCPCSDEMLEGFSCDDDLPVMAFDPRRRTNAALIADLVSLGFLHDGQHILDLTYGIKGAFWKRWRPPLLVTNDLDIEAPTDLHFDFRKPNQIGQYDVVVYDPPYGYRGTSRLESDACYGIDGPYVPPDERDALIVDGLYGAYVTTKPGGLILCKMQDQTVSGRKRHQTKMIWNELAGTEYGCQLIMELHVFSHRKQPAGVAQKLVHQNYSTAQLYRKPL